MEADASPATETSLPPERVAGPLDEGRAQVIDLREASGWGVGPVGGARHIEFDQVSAHADTIDMATPVVFQCRGGSRSEMIAAAFRESGWDAYNIEAGLRAWEERELPLEPEGGRIEGA